MKSCRISLRTICGNEDSILYKDDIFLPEGLMAGDEVVIDGMSLIIKKKMYDTKSTKLYIYVEDFHLPKKHFVDKGWKVFR